NDKGVQNSAEYDQGVRGFYSGNLHETVSETMVTPNARNVSAEPTRMTDKIIVMSTCGSSEEAQRLARELVAQRAAACVNIVAPVRSIYRWNGRIEDTEEWLLIVKTTRSSFDRLRTILEAAHS